MPDWQPVSVPDFCPICKVYWECGCRPVGAALKPEDIERARQSLENVGRYPDYPSIVVVPGGARR